MAMGVICSDSNSMVCHRPLHHFSVGSDTDFSLQTFHCREIIENPSCDACIHCADHCDDINCEQCSRKKAASSLSNHANIFGSPEGETYYTMCQLRRHDNTDSAWLTVGDTIYDATSYIANHPGGKMSILKKAGGKADCTIDFDFHSKNARNLWKKYKVGKLFSCPGPNGASGFGTNEQCIIS
mmetsp:Transcript_32455/g.48044  ORF Transcript_32455/g.48044 Transcript_32455/m.48044 type:complete len:183 (-) Transcript_32455:259-807(-)